jgi:hypothetical protein
MDYANVLSTACIEAELQRRKKRRKKYNRQNGHKSKIVAENTTINIRQQQQLFLYINQAHSHQHLTQLLDRLMIVSLVKEHLSYIMH